MYNLQIFDLFFKVTDIGLLWSKITIFIIEITIKLCLHRKYGWNNPNWGRLGLKNPNLHFFAISGCSKFIAYTNVQIHVTCWMFIIIFFFLEILVMMSSIKINNNWNYQKMQILDDTIPLNTFWTLELLFPISEKEFVLVLSQFSKTIILNFLLHSKIHHSWFLLICKCIVLFRRSETNCS